MNPDELRRRRALRLYEHDAINKSRSEEMSEWSRYIEMHRAKRPRYKTPITIAAECGYVLVILASMAWIATMILNH